MKSLISPGKLSLMLVWTACFMGFNWWLVTQSAVDDQYDTVTISREEASWITDDDDSSFEREQDDGIQTMEHVMGDGSKSGSRPLEEKIGKVAWLMSFPNSGTSFTSLLIRHASNTTTATNYGMECSPGQDGKSVPVYEWSLKGPYWLHPLLEESDDEAEPSGSVSKRVTATAKASYGIPSEGSSILTKTHCGSRCTFCPPSTYLETWQSFLTMCSSGARSIPIADANSVDAKSLKNAKSGYIKDYGTYDSSLVERAVHLVRDPFDNLVSRFHHEQKEHAKRNDSKWNGRYSNNAHGFRKWCADEDMFFRKEENKVNWDEWGYSQEDMTMHFEGVACHAEFFRYVQWHNLAIEAVQKLGIPSIHVHYGDYVTDLEGNTKEMLNFLSLTRAVRLLPLFESNKNYSEYFSGEERAAASEFMIVVASDDCEKILERYFVKLDYSGLKKQTQSIID